VKIFGKFFLNFKFGLRNSSSGALKADRPPSSVTFLNRLAARLQTHTRVVSVRLDRALILLGLAVCLLSTSVLWFHGAMFCYIFALLFSELSGV